MAPHMSRIASPYDNALAFGARLSSAAGVRAPPAARPSDGERTGTSFLRNGKSIDDVCFTGSKRFGLFLGMGLQGKGAVLDCTLGLRHGVKGVVAVR
jgi:hypothetical protein